MRVEGTYKTPIHGVSTLAPRNRADGHAELQVNLRSDPVQKLTRRPPLVFAQHLMTMAESHYRYVHHEYRKDGDTFTIMVNLDNGHVNSFKNYIQVGSTHTAAAPYCVGGDIVMRTINDTTYLLNKDKIILRGNGLDTELPVTHINVLSALNYGETLTVGIGSTADSPATTVSYTVPDLGTTEPDYDTADKARATTAVARGIADAFLAQSWFTAAYNVFVLGSSLAIKRKAGTLIGNQWVTMYIITGQGDRSARVFGQRISDTEGLPLYSVDGTIITVRPNPASPDGTYYLKAERIADSAVTTDIYLEECVWAETRSPHETYDIWPNAMPHTVTYDTVSEEFTVAAGDWKDRRTGDDESCPFPEFIGERLVDIGQFQNRLVFLAKGSVYMSETDDYGNWFKASAIKLLVTDPVGITSSAADTEAIQHISSHNRDMLLVAANGQFKIDGNVAVTPQTVSMPKVSSYDCDVTVAPVPMGANVILGLHQGKSAGILQYTTKKATEQEFGKNVSKHIVGLMKGSITRMVGSVNSDMIVVTTSDSASNVLYVYENYDDSGEVMQNSWSTWELPDDIDIIGLTFTSDTLKVFTRHDNNVSLYEVDLYSRVAETSDEVFLDYLVTLDSQYGLSVELPANYPWSDDTIVVQGEGSLFPLYKAEYTKVGNVITFDEDLTFAGSCKVHIGVPVSARYIPTRPFRRDESGLILTQDRIRVARWRLYVVDTHEITGRIISDYVELDDQTFEGRTMGQTDNLVGKKSSHTGDLLFSYSQNASQAKIEFFTDGYLGLTIGGISWNGQFYKSSGRMR